MAREKMFDPRYQKAFVEAIEKQNELNKKTSLGGICGPLHTSKVNWEDDDLSDEEPQNCDSCGKPMTEEGKSTSDKRAGTHHKQPLKAEPLKEYPEYIFPLCDYCDFGWRFDSRKKVFCPHHGSQGQYVANMYFKDSSDQQRTAN
ncbi:uncharacterized protein CDAR_247171 [Caerostris darwini]|uniref:Uncharacterized protein n=1 Tax=Caerostris darwini TaxID=1538125 RepID=A0AAV4TR20_9ARAC|nr:uncharacterized protein CDAR_247171 [Caerostris darwini]